MACGNVYGVGGLVPAIDAANAELLTGILAARPFACDVAVCVPFPYLSEAAVALAGSDVRWGAQDCSAHEKGAYTGAYEGSYKCQSK